MVRNFLQAYADQRSSDRRAELRRALIRRESKIGGELFGPIPAGHKREFFCLDRHTWVWHEEWTENGQRRIVNTRYEVRPNGVLKSQNGNQYKKISASEGRRLLQAVNLYGQRVRNELYDFAA